MTFGWLAPHCPALSPRFSSFLVPAPSIIESCMCVCTCMYVCTYRSRVGRAVPRLTRETTVCKPSIGVKYNTRWSLRSFVNGQCGLAMGSASHTLPRFFAAIWNGVCVMEEAVERCLSRWVTSTSRPLRALTLLAPEGDAIVVALRTLNALDHGTVGVLPPRRLGGGRRY